MKNHNYLLLISIITLLQWSESIKAQGAQIPFDTIHWEFSDAKTGEFLGRPCLSGTAYLREGTLENGVVECDVAVTGQRSYPGILFRVASPEDYERVYIRPHLSPVFRNVVQYVSTFQGIDSWQLYTGEGNAASAEIPKNSWFHVKIEIKGIQARVFINNSPQPVMLITSLQHGSRSGGLGVSGPNDETAFFSNFSFRKDDNLKFPDEKIAETPYGMVENWQLSQVFRMSGIDMEVMPDEQGIKDLLWKEVTCRRDGIVDISRFCKRSGNAPDVVYARTIIESEKATTKLFAFGYSDIVSIFVNGKFVFAGNSSYTSRDPNFQGIVGLNDYLNIPLQKGKNEIMIALAESFGGWGFIFRDARDVYKDKGVKQLWEIKNKFHYPESVQYDKQRDVLYVSNYFNDGQEYISKVSLKGEILSMDWLGGIYQPSGMTMFNNKLYVVGRMALIEIDPDKGAILNRFRFPDPGMPNDVTVDDKGVFYITDSKKDAIYIFSDGKITEWLRSDGIQRPNGILWDNGQLLVGTSGDGCIKKVNLTDKTVSTLVCLGNGAIMDGLVADGNGNYLISDFNGKIYRVTPDGEKRLLVDSTAPSIFSAAFDYIPEKHLLVVPAFTDNRVVAFEIPSR